jgi:hypothetical protein
LCAELEHLKIETRLIDEKWSINFSSSMLIKLSFFLKEKKPTEMARSLTATPEPGIPPYGTAPVKPSLAWTDIKLDEVKKFMKIEKVGAAVLPAPS